LNPPTTSCAPEPSYSTVLLASSEIVSKFVGNSSATRIRALLLILNSFDPPLPSRVNELRYNVAPASIVASFKIVRSP